MHILVVGLNYKTAPVEIREKLNFQPEELAVAMKQLKKQKSVLENVIVSTCNRTELYAVVDQLHTGRYYIKAFLAEWFGLDKDEITPYLTIFEQDGALDHLCKVACGLDSMILGETQILGQVRSSFLLAQEHNTIGTIFNQLFKQVITLAKRSHSETDIGANAVSVSYAAVELAKKIFGDLRSKHVLILGAGKMGELAVQNLHGSGVGKVTVMNRTLQKAEELANRFDGNAKGINELQCGLIEADILISSTGAKNFVITKEMVTHVEKMRKGRPLFMVDIAVPRDLDPKLADLDSVFLYDIDDLQGIVEANLQERKVAAEKIELMIEEEIVQFKQWINTLGVVPVIAALRNKALTVQAETMESIERKMPNLTERERKVLNKHTKSIINQLLKDPIVKVKELSAEPNAQESLDLFKKIFNIEDDVEEQMVKERLEKQSLRSNEQMIDYRASLQS
ncbi:glutamyl-tRNA reductase [Metabacillus crassostreae]|uniref:glutamyl-tRNA reductase n=1 Tax=Metabacillus crassostreae TaxID=929098 RepID=UPI0019596320|nr:glutamyl-tRNA reductase [Metabacillus crassostreae]MBM7605730.1 glutamyl-tRNA reductase [Metabacillus crassostreae]